MSFFRKLFKYGAWDFPSCNGNQTSQAQYLANAKISEDFCNCWRNTRKESKSKFKLLHCSTLRTTQKTKPLWFKWYESKCLMQIHGMNHVKFWSHGDQIAKKIIKSDFYFLVLCCTETLRVQWTATKIRDKLNFVSDPKLKQLSGDVPTLY